MKNRKRWVDDMEEDLRQVEVQQGCRWAEEGGVGGQGSIRAVAPWMIMTYLDGY